MTTKEIETRSKDSLSFVSNAFDQGIYDEIARRARLLDVVLAKQAYEIKYADFLEAENENRLDYSFIGEPLGVTDPSENGMIIGGYRWRADLKHGRKKVLKLATEYTLLYSGLSGANPEYVQLYFNKLARFTSYPYFRSMFATCAANSGVSLAPLPSLTDRVD